MNSSKDFFNNNLQTEFAPLAERMRPASLKHYVGQSHILGKDKPLRNAIEQGQLHSFILWGPPGVGKTTLANLLANHAKAEFISVSAIMSGVKDIRALVEQAEQNLSLQKRTVVFVDEIHRFNKSQQDTFLPYVERGLFTLIGATTENPSFELNNALLSRCRVYKLRPLSSEQLNQLVDEALNDEKKGLGELNVSLHQDARQLILKAAQGDSRRLYNLLELAADFAGRNNPITTEHLAEVVGETVSHFDNKGEHFYDLISALHKSVRGSDANAALYWFSRMIIGGCDPLYIARRVVRMASEDIGNADPRALTLALDAWQVQERLGSPEGELAIAQALTYLSAAAKSNAVYVAHKEALAAAKSFSANEVPLHLRNAPTKLMKSFGYGKAYRYSHDEPEAFSAGQSYWPNDMPPHEFYRPQDRGLETKIQQKFEYLKQLNQQAIKR